MHCPHCGHLNIEGRKYCRGCAKPLTAATAPPKPAPPAPISLSPRPTLPAPHFTSTPSPVTTTATPLVGTVVHPMAIACLALSFLSFFLPLGIAAAVMGHLSRRQIVQSNGRQTGTGLAFAGLIICYLQFSIVLLVGMGIVSAVHEVNKNLDREPDTRAALVQKYGKIQQKSPAEVARQRREAIDALRLIGASESEFFAAHLERAYSCDFYPMGWDATRDNELNLHIVNSHHKVKIYQCGAGDNPIFSAVAIPWGDSNPPDSPTFCVDQTGVLRRYAASEVNELNRTLLTDRQPCPQSGEVVE